MANLRLIEEVEEPAIPAPKSDLDEAALNILLTALKALSQRTIIALAGLQTLAAIAAVLFIWYLVLLPNPSWPQIAGATLFSGFVLMALWLKR